jgi:hypothetical protein
MWFRGFCMATDEPTHELADRSPCRGFSLGDGMIAMAAVALCLAIARVLFPFFRRGLGGIPFDRLSNLSDWKEYLASRPEVAGGLAIFTSLGLVVLLLVWSLAFVAMRLRTPRPTLGHVLMQPGMVAVEGMWAGVVLGMIPSLFDVAAVFGMLAAASAVPVAWGVLALAGRWHPESGWLDRFGRALGVCWCLLMPVYLALILVFIGPPLW